MKLVNNENASHSMQQKQKKRCFLFLMGSVDLFFYQTWTANWSRMLHRIVFRCFLTICFRFFNFFSFNFVVAFYKLLPAFARFCLCVAWNQTASRLRNFVGLKCVSCIFTYVSKRFCTFFGKEDFVTVRRLLNSHSCMWHIRHNLSHLVHLSVYHHHHSTCVKE